jgi:hypothetical protein
MVAPLETHAFGFLIVPSQAPKVFTMRVVQGGGGRGSGNSHVRDSMTCMELWCHAAS